MNRIMVGRTRTRPLPFPCPASPKVEPAAYRPPRARRWTWNDVPSRAGERARGHFGHQHDDLDRLQLVGCFSSFRAATSPPVIFLITYSEYHPVQLSQKTSRVLPAHSYMKSRTPCKMGIGWAHSSVCPSVCPTDLNVWMARCPFWSSLPKPTSTLRETAKEDGRPSEIQIPLHSQPAPLRRPSPSLSKPLTNGGNKPTNDDDDDDLAAVLNLKRCVTPSKCWAVSVDLPMCSTVTLVDQRWTGYVFKP